MIRNQGKQDKSVQTEFRVSRWEAPVDQQKCYVCPRLIAIQSTRIILKQQISDPRYRASPMSPNGRADGVFRFLAGNRAFRPTRCREIFTVAQTLALTGRAANTADYCGRGLPWPWTTVAVDYCGRGLLYWPPSVAACRDSDHNRSDELLRFRAASVEI
ncbi:MAG: hypothetical protein DWH78_09420 [Planctomycetota bacterium]|nr:MAG: hypothetical protein DWH78_09420 [Planctomycetota bacterium]